MKRRMLFLSHRLPFPPHSGAALRTYHALRILATEYEVDALCFDRPDRLAGGMPLEARVQGLSWLGSVAVFPIPQLDSRSRLAWDHVRSVVTGRPYTWYVHDSRAFLATLRGSLSSRYDLVFVDSLDLVRALPEIPPGSRVVCTHHNVESDLLRQRAKSESRPWRAWYLAHQSRLLREAEHAWMPLIDLNIAVSANDESRLAELAPAAAIRVVPNGVDVEYFQPSPEPPEPYHLVFVGGTTWYPNLDALRWFREAIYPRLRSAESRTRVTWVGRATKEEMSTYSDPPYFSLTGYVSDIRPFVASANCFVAPLRVGGGTRLKLLDAWAMGKAIVSTPLGAEGLSAVHNEDMLIADDLDGFVEGVLTICRDEELRLRLERRARHRAVNEYSWDVIGGNLLQMLAALQRPQ